MKASLGRSAILLAVIGIIAKLIGALYRVPLTNIVGAEGMGLYQMVFPLYTVLLAFCGGSATSAVSRVVAKYTAKGDDATALRVLRVAFVPLGLASLISAAGVALLRNLISGVQGNTAAGICYLALAPSLLFAGGISVFRGYFQGKSKMLPSGISQLIEQSVKLFLGLALGSALLSYGVKYAVAGALTGVSASELIALAYLSIRFAVAKKRRKRVIATLALSTEAAADVSVVTDRELMKELYSFALPVTFGSLVLPITQMIDSALVINILMHGGTARDEATALFGLFVGPVGTLVNMPAVIVLSVSIAFLPTLTAAIERGDGDKAERLTRDAAKWILVFVIPVTLAFFLFPERIVSTLYRRGLTAEQPVVAARLLRIQAVAVFYVGVLQLSTTFLQAHNKSHRPVINLVVGACVKVGLTPVLVRTIGVYGAACATAACYAVAALLTTRSAFKTGAIGASVRDGLLLPVAFSAAACVGFVCAVKAAEALGAPYLWQSLTGAAVFLLLYCTAAAFAVTDIRAALARRRAMRAADGGAANIKRRKK